MCNTTSSLNCHLTCFWKLTGKHKGIPTCVSETLLCIPFCSWKGNLRVPLIWKLPNLMWEEQMSAQLMKTQIVIILVLLPYMVAFFLYWASAGTPTFWYLTVKWSVCYFLLHTLRWVSGSFFKYIFLSLAWWSVKALPPLHPFSHRLELIYTHQTKQDLCIRLSE